MTLSCSLVLAYTLAGSTAVEPLVFLLQFSSQSEASDSNQQLQHAMEERAQLETHVGQVRICEGRGGHNPRWPRAHENQGSPW